MEENASPRSDEWRTHLYSQVPLRWRNGDIRLLTIQSRNFSKSTAATPEDQPQIQCFLTLANLKQQPKFVAVSHTCDTHEDRSLLVNGALVPVSYDVFHVLEHLQEETEPITIWIDTLCINKGDTEERSAQVAQLADVFSVASSTIVWLGTAVEGSDEAMGALGRLAEENLTPAAQKLLLTALRKTPLAANFPPPDYNTNGQGRDQDQTHSASSEKELSLDDQLQSLRSSFQSLMNRDYWSRLWSLQELVFTSKGLVVCGPRKMDLERFYMSAKALDGVLNMATYSKWLAASKAPSSPAVLENTEPANFSASPAIRLLAEREFFRGGRGWWSSTDHPLLSILSRYYLPASDPRIKFNYQDERDLIFGFIGLASDKNGLENLVDYSKDYRQICTETTLSLLKQNPKVLQLCQADHADTDKPSWLVDWSVVEMPVSYSSGRSINACGPADTRFYRVEVDPSNAGIISLKGVLIGIVQNVLETNPENSEQSNTPTAAIDRLFKQSLDTAKSPYSAEQAPDIPPSMLTNKPFIMDTGYVGCGGHLIEGDSIAIFYGSEVPFAMRKQPDETLRLIGEVYVHGVMEGEYMKVHRKESILCIS
ncbi:heterokaryon incompatibility [Seiridium cupressi]